MDKHTPGPWSASRFVDESCAIDAPGWTELAIVHGQENRDEGNPLWHQARANARLIATAPELLEACRTALRGFEDDHDYGQWDLVRAAIAKAEGK